MSPILLWNRARLIYPEPNRKTKGLFEEAAGIVKHKSRKEEAERLKRPGMIYSGLRIWSGNWKTA